MINKNMSILLFNIIAKKPIKKKTILNIIMYTIVYNSIQHTN